MTSFNITTVSTILTCISILFIELHKNEEKIFHFQQKKKYKKKKDTIFKSNYFFKNSQRC